MMSLMWLTLIRYVCLLAVLLTCLQPIGLFQRIRFSDSKLFLGGEKVDISLIELSQGSRGAPSSSIQFSPVTINVIRGLDYGAKVVALMTKAVIHITDSMSIDEMDIYCWIDFLKTGGNLFETKPERMCA